MQCIFSIAKFKIFPGAAPDVDGNTTLLSHRPVKFQPLQTYNPVMCLPLLNTLQCHSYILRE